MSAPRTRARVDANLWYILGHYLHHQLTGDLEFLERHWSSIERALIWLEFQDMNECGLLEIPEAGDWMDLLAVRYNVLYDNVLYYAALLAYQELHDRLRQCPAHPYALCRRGGRPRAHQPADVDRSLLGRRSTSPSTWKS